MDDKISTPLILLTYKGKALLMYKMSSAIDTVKHEWCLISCTNEDEESPENAIIKSVKNEASIKLESIEQISKYFYHSRLTDDNVNKIERSEGQLLDFFTLKELNKLNLSSSTKLFISKHANLIEKSIL